MYSIVVLVTYISIPRQQNSTTCCIVKGYNTTNDIGFFDLFYNFWIQKSHHFYDFWIQKLFCPFLQFLDPETAVFLQFLDPETAPFLRFLDPEFFFVHFYNFWIQKLQYFCSFWIQKLHHFYNFWGPYGSWGDVCLAPAGGPMDRTARLNLT